jgi:CHAT domain-containing protein/uncharacterized protein YkwD
VGQRGESTRVNKTSYIPNSSRAELVKGKDLLRRNRTDQALTSVSTALKSLKQAGDAQGEAAAHDALGDIFVQNGQYRVALQEYQAGQELFRAAKDDINADLAQAKIGDLYSLMDKGAEAAAAYKGMKAAPPPASGVPVATNLSAANNKSPSPPPPFAGDEQRAFDLVNAERKAKGLSPLAWDNQLAQMARSHSENMARGGFRSHTDQAGLDMSARANSFSIRGYEVLGENIGYSEGSDDPVAVVLERWMNHDSHRDNILRPEFTHAGMGVARASDGEELFTQVFTARSTTTRQVTVPTEGTDLYRKFILYSIREIGQARAAFKLGQLDEAQRHFESALASAASAALSRLAQTRRSRIVALTGMGDVAFRRGNYPEAARLYTEALNSANRDGRPELAWAAQRGLGRTFWAQAARETDPLTALRLRGDAIAAYRLAIGIIEGLLVGSFRSEEARRSFTATTQEVFEESSAALAEMALMTAPPNAVTLDGVALTYGAAALQVAEQGRSNALLELLGAARAEITEGVTAELQRRKAEIQARRNEIAELIGGVRLNGALTTADAEALEAESERLEAQYTEVENQIRTSNPRYAALTKPQSLTVSDIQQQVLDDDTALLEYGLGNDSSYLWALTRKTLSLAKLPSRSVVEDKAQAFRALLAPSSLPRSIISADAPPPQATRGIMVAATTSEPAAVAPYIATARNLYQILIEPVAPAIAGKRLLIAADGALHFIPFEALVTSGEGGNYGDLSYLVKSHEVVYAPSATVLGTIRQRTKSLKSRGQLLIVADPIFDASDPRAKQELAKRGQTGEQTGSLRLLSALEDISRLPSAGRIKLPRLIGTRDEAEQISKFATASGNSAVTMLDLDASETGLSKQTLNQYGVLHFATHGLLDPTRPQFSGLALSLGLGQESDDGFLQVEEVFNLRLSDPLVMLSACETGLGELKRGDGVSGLTRAFMYAGAPTIGVSLWSISDKATAELMSGFYKRLLTKENLSASKALRASQLEMISSERFSSPFYWAPFVLIGDWR